MNSKFLTTAFVIGIGILALKSIGFWENPKSSSAVTTPKDNDFILIKLQALEDQVNNQNLSGEVAQLTLELEELKTAKGSSCPHCENLAKECDAHEVPLEGLDGDEEVLVPSGTGTTFYNLEIEGVVYEKVWATNSEDKTVKRSEAPSKPIGEGPGQWFEDYYIHGVFYHRLYAFPNAQEGELEEEPVFRSNCTGNS